jgi:hypothetical protein
MIIRPPFFVIVFHNHFLLGNVEKSTFYTFK